MGTTQRAIIQFQTIRARATVVRPDDTTQYSDGDVIANDDDSHLVFENVVVSSAERLSGSINMAIIRSSANASTKPELELWLFARDITEVGDNAAFAPSDDELDELVGIIDFPAANWRTGNPDADEAGNSVCIATHVGVTFRLPTTNLYGVLVVRDDGNGAYTPVSEEVFTVDLIITRD